MNFARIIDLEALAFLTTLSALIAVKLLTGKIPLKGLLQSKDGSMQVSPARVQLLVTTLACAAGLALHSGNSKALPDISPIWNYLLGASGATYAGSKLMSYWNQQKTS